MKEAAIARLLEISRSALAEPAISLSAELIASAGAVAVDLRNLLQHRNGLYAFESALHVFPARSDAEEIGLDAWNSSDLWRSGYEGAADKPILVELRCVGLPDSKTNSFLDAIAADLRKKA